MSDVRAGGSRVRTVFLGSGSFGVESVRRLAVHPDIDLVAVVTAPARSTPISETVRALDVDHVLTPKRLRAPESIDEVLGLRPDLLVLADYGQIVPSALLELRHGALNLHPSLLPRHRGATPIPATILAGDEETGVTLFRMDAGLDTGPIVGQRRLALRGDEVAPELEATLATQAADLLDTVLGPWLRGALTATPQSDEGATLTRPLRREDGRLDPMRTTTELERQVRAYQPWPGSFVDTVVGRVVVWRAEDVNLRIDGEDGTPGRIGAFGMYARDRTYVAFREVQPAGGRRMSWDEFLRGRPAVVGSQVLLKQP